MSDYVPSLESTRSLIVEMTETITRDDEAARENGEQFDRLIAKVRADALEKVLELHRPVRGASRRSPDVCAECDALIGEPGYDCGGTVEYPCPTATSVQAVINAE